MSGAWHKHGQQALHVTLGRWTPPGRRAGRSGIFLRARKGGAAGTFHRTGEGSSLPPPCLFFHVYDVRVYILCALYTFLHPLEAGRGMPPMMAILSPASPSKQHTHTLGGNGHVMGSHTHRQGEESDH